MLAANPITISDSFSTGALELGMYAIERPSMCTMDVAKKSRQKILTSHKAINGTLKIVATVKMEQYVFADNPNCFLSKNIASFP